MERPIVYSGQIPLAKDILDLARQSHAAHAVLLEAIRGGLNEGVYGLDVLPTPSPSMQVKVGRGVIAQPIALDATAYSELAADATLFLKFGYQTADFTISGTPSLPTAGNKRIFTVQAKLVEVDADSVVLPYYNEADPSDALLGPGDSGTPQNRRRTLSILYEFKGGTTVPNASTATPPTPDFGYIALAQFEIKSTTTQISLAADSTTNAKIKAYAGAAGTPKINNFALLDAALNIFEGDIISLGDISAVGNLAATGTVGSQSDASSGDHVPRLSQFAASAAGSGYVKIPTPGNDIIIQWVGMTATGAGFGTNFNWPIAFPNAVYAAVGSVHANVDGIGEEPKVWFHDVTTTGGVVHSDAVQAVRFIGIGS